MSDSLYPKRSTGAGDDNLIPLINIVFLLLIFFMVAGQIAQHTEAGIESPQSQSRHPLETETLELVLDAGGSVSSDDQTYSLETLGDYVRSHMNADGVLNIVLTADRSIQAATLDPVLTRLRELGVKTVRLRTLRTDTP